MILTAIREPLQNLSDRLRPDNIFSILGICRMWRGMDLISLFLEGEDSTRRVLQ